MLTPSKLKRTYNILEKWAETIAKSYKKKLQKSRASGELADTLSFGVKQSGFEFEVYLELLDYWKYIEDGRPSGTFPPVDAIVKWIHVKPIIPQPYVLPSGKQVIPTENQLAFLIGRKISEEGTTPQFYLFETMEELRLGLIQALARAFSEDIRDELIIEFTQ